MTGSLEAKDKAAGGAAREESALNMFRQMDLRGKSKDDTKLTTVHQNTISTLRVHEGGEGGADVRKFSSKSSLSLRELCILTLSCSERCRWEGGRLECVGST